MRISDHDGARRHLRQLDVCLHELENAHEQNQVTVTQDVASRISGLVPSILPGMPITQAINLVLQEQEHYLSPTLTAVSVKVGLRGGVGRTALAPASAATEPPLNEADARELTERIRAATRYVCLLLFEAHRRRAWHALGYPTWEKYVLSEFGLSRTRSYELLDQARVIRALQAAACTFGTPEVSAYAAEQIKPYLDEVIEVVRRRTIGATEKDALEIVAAAVREQQGMIARDGRRGEGGVQKAARVAMVEADALERLRVAIESLARMPPVDEVVARFKPNHEPDGLATMERAVGWLNEFASECRRRGVLPAAAIVDGWRARIESPGRRAG